ncbi:NAD(+) synthase [Mycoplasmopsis citelli]|uniref:NH(3)-dependent NAD(+) synthetase n=1 Tax=Mycoplasmopsis citelli TaxID=171281 RepID=A0A449B1A0_9BACT|nr:NAD(+) synthase [Mycoplasmopsis citelli]UUD35841.1 NAD(+) synthase [Mycoplasmopsis citelli]VEU74372.1 NAD+ synthetase [Mycoplasmopsis citelli]
MSKITSYQNNQAFYDKETALKYLETIKKFLKTKVKNANAQGVIVGISGGIDSSLVYTIAKQVFPNHTIGVVMPIEKMTQSDLNHISQLEQATSSKFLVKDLTKPFKEMLNILDVTNHLAVANIKPRLRMTTLYAIAQQNNSLVLGTDNADEVFVGYFTKFGDGGADLLPISKLTKGEVRFLASLLNVPQSILDKAPSAGLWEGQSDENELGFSYDQLDFYINNLNDTQNIQKNIEPKIVDKIEQLHKNSQHKRDKVYTPKDVK